MLPTAALVDHEASVATRRRHAKKNVGNSMINKVKGDPDQGRMERIGDADRGK
jgi:hypothetical protein